MQWWPSSVCLTSVDVSRIVDPKSKTEWHSKLEIGRREAHDTGDPRLHLEVKRSELKVIWPINAKTEYQPYVWNGKAYELQTWYTDGVPRPASPTCTVTSKVKGQGYNVTRRQFDGCLPITRQRSQILAPAATWRIKIKMITILYENYIDDITLQRICVIYKRHMRFIYDASISFVFVIFLFPRWKTTFVMTL